MKTILLFACLSLSFTLNAQTLPDSVAASVMEADRTFWEAYNTCDVEAMLPFFTQDLEFYHDMNGLMNDMERFEEGTRKGLCAEGGNRTRRAVVEGTVSLHPVPGHGVIMEGEHWFFETPPGGTEYRTGRAKFVHVWTQVEGEWKMSRVLSYAHRAAPPEVTTVSLSAAELERFCGQYLGQGSGALQIAKGDNSLTLSSEHFSFTLLPTDDHTFALPDRPITVRFQVENDQVIGFKVLENGQEAETAERVAE